MIGGFLGSGKTTAVAWLAQKLAKQGLRVGLITNDQGQNLVDTNLLRSQGHVTEEIPGGCFCCRFDSLVNATQRLTESTHPEVFVAEPVGSCTDLAATVTYPLRQLYGGQFKVAPVSVLLDPIRALRAFGLEQGGSFTEKVLYIYFKQIEEADLVVISKCDLLDSARLNTLRNAIAARFQQKEIMAVSVKNGIDLDAWFERMTTTEQSASRAMEVDYQVYADGEALLGWLNCTVRLASETAFDAQILLKNLAEAIQKHLKAKKAEVAHLKMTLCPNSKNQEEMAAINLVRNDFVPEFSRKLKESIKSGQLTINLRAETDPDTLGNAVHCGLADTRQVILSLISTQEHLEQFRPGKPTPTHRIQLLPA